MTGIAALDSAPPAAPVPLSMFNPIPIGIDEFGHRVAVRVIYKNVLAAGEPGGGKSALLQIIAVHAALSARSRLVLFDGKLVELGLLKTVADEFVGADIDRAIITLRRLQRVMDNRYAWLEACGRRKIEPFDGVTTITAIFDEIALYSTVLGTEQQQREFVTLLRDLVARGRAAGIIVIAATQRPSVDIIPKSLRDLFGYRAAFRCTSDGSSDIILGDGWSGQGFTATDIPPTNPGVALLIAEGGTPKRIKTDYLTDDDIKDLAAYAAWKRGTTTPLVALPAALSPSLRGPVMFNTDPAVRDQFITGLRQLADFLDAHPDVPVPPYGTTITVNAESTDNGGMAQVDVVAEQLGASVDDDTAESGHYRTMRAFGSVGYDVVAISDVAYARHRAESSYWGCVTPDSEAANA